MQTSSIKIIHLTCQGDGSTICWVRVAVDLPPSLLPTAESHSETRPPAASGYVECTTGSGCRPAVSNVWVGVAVDLQCVMCGSGCRPAVTNLWGGSGRKAKQGWLYWIVIIKLQQEHWL